jgi:preprotein translocase subunit SecE
MAHAKPTKTKQADAALSGTSWRDRLIWWLVTLLLCLALFASFYFASVGLPIRVLALIVVAGISFGLASLTVKGKEMIQYLIATRMELYKVTWPNRTETMQSSMVVVFVVFVVSMLLWGIDSLWLRLVSGLIGY